MKCKGCKQQFKAENCQRCCLEAMNSCSNLAGELVKCKLSLGEVYKIISIHHLSSLDKAKKYIRRKIINGRD
jgi:hypothetical protein